MASACINTISLSPQSYAWFQSNTNANTNTDQPQESHSNDFDAFEFSLQDPVMMLPADQLFSQGKLLPLQVATTIDTPHSHPTTDQVFAADPHLHSPRAPRCSSRWKDLLGFGKIYQTTNNIAKQNTNKRTTGTRSITHFLHRTSKSANDASINLPLLKDADNESVSVSSRPSLSSSSSGHDLDDLPRLSLDSDKPGKVNLTTNPNSRPKTRMVKTRTRSTEGRSNTMRESTVRGVSLDSPRMNSSGKIVFQSLERSSSSPSSLNGGARLKHRGMERSYSANVRVLNVPVCSLRGSSKSGGVFGFPIFTSQQKREGCNQQQQRPKSKIEG